MFIRWVESRLLKALERSPVVLVNGPRQAGKTTLVRNIANGGYQSDYVTLDNPTTRDSALKDPVGFIQKYRGPLIIDEIQRAPDLLLAIKESVDNDRRPGRFMITGSARVLLLPKVSETLAGRVEILTLWPLSQGEILGAQDGLIDALFTGTLEQKPDMGLTRPELIGRVLAGGYPEAVSRSDEGDRLQWFEDYLTTITQREIQDIADVERLTEIPSLLTALAIRSRAPINKSDISSDLGIPRTTLKRYLSLLQYVFITRALPGWHRSQRKQLVKSPKLLLSDSGLMSHLMGVDTKRLEIDDATLGLICENFVGMELVKQLTWSKQRAEIYHLRSSSGIEVDIVIETPDQRVIALEIKIAASVGSSDFKHLAWFRDQLGDRFIKGVVLYTGNRVLPFGDRLEAVPLSSLWLAG